MNIKRTNNSKTAKWLIAALLLLSPSAVTAQVQSVIDRAYTFVTIGGQLYQNDANRAFQHIGFQGEAGLGANMFDLVGMRVGIGVGHNTNIKDVESNYLGIHFDVTFNVTHLIYGKDPNQRSHLQAFIGAGLIQRQSNYLQPADNDVTLIPGLKYTCPLFNGMYFLAEAKSLVFTSRFDENRKISAKFLLSVGIEQRFNDNNYRNGIHSGANSSYENWHVTLSGGVNSLQYSGLSSDQRMHLLKPAAELSVGKFLSPVLGLRLGVMGISAATADKEFNILNTHADVTFNLANMKLPRQNRPFNLSLYAGVGLINRFDMHNMTVDVNAGALGRIWLTKRSDLTIDLRYMMTMSRFLSDMPKQGQTSVGILTAMVGYTYNITNGNLR